MPASKMDTRQVILDTARRIVLAKGYAAVGITEVLSAAGVPKGSFYHWFESKDAFGEAMMKSYFDDYFATMDRIAAQAEKSAAEHVMEYWQYFYDTQAADHCQGGCLVVKLGAEIADLSDAMRATTKSGTAAIVDRLEKMIADGVADGSLSVDDTPRATAEALYDMWLGASMIAKIHGHPRQLDRAMAVTRRTLHV
ncbi:TetR/AcrR family transcriptional regulator, transcriptional repressor for nem operon [Amycolatopsis pretoriensis]|uniref:TetR/AcrR family transcriptional regulator, transcriptional repressor for nem operon n=1 Tax=Amycolatopsis pretoriensis TaxID=218821 RepID=A0A1H5R1X8_9PSEU|nr:TetR/AcrR family transcriptional regulator [Amycolatopsis pretoriensis]SEF32329.1 TetR/AcrR family transcriptional regulator, transcriptional repressor for nem operon [Amycolatopsis pretoriensis]